MMAYSPASVVSGVRRKAREDMKFFKRLKLGSIINVGTKKALDEVEASEQRAQLLGAIQQQYPYQQATQQVQQAAQQAQQGITNAQLNQLSMGLAGQMQYPVASISNASISNVTFPLVPNGDFGELQLEEQHIVVAITAWRRWGHGGLFSPKLHSENDTPWEPKQALKADCRIGGCAGVRCTCGIYAFKEKDQLFAQGYNPAYSVYGQVSLWGVVVECTRGFRAEYAYPKNIVNTSFMARRIAALYGVPLIEAQ
jgi:hypothetical protein